MGFLDGKKILVTGLLSERVERLAPEFGSEIVLPCDVSSDANSRVM